MTRDEVFDELARREIFVVHVGFSGGNDEGFVDSIRLFDVQGAKVAQWEEPWGERVTPDEKLAAALCWPVYDTFGSFAGEFYVSGTFVWNMELRTVTYNGDPVPEGKRIWEWAQ